LGSGCFILGVGVLSTILTRYLDALERLGFQPTDWGLFACR
jgi:hypothetical protein